jgi:porphobilinogen synthase
MQYRSVIFLFFSSLCAGFLSASPHSFPRRLGVSSKISPFNPEDGNHAVLSRNNQGHLWLNQMARPRRNRKSDVVRSMIRENFVAPCHLIHPMFIHDGLENEEIASMPGVFRLTLKGMLDDVSEAMKLGIRQFLLFPKVPDALKTNLAEECYNPEGIVPRAIRLIKAKYPEAVVSTDIALDPYSDQGHDGVVIDGKIVNDETVAQLCKQAVCHARAGCDVVAPSDMMDGRVKAIRKSLDAEGFTDISILSYSAKYASSFYGPFRDALGSHPGFGDKKTYQQDPANSREAVMEALLDAAEGADMLMIKPGLPYLDVIRIIRDSTHLVKIVFFFACLVIRFLIFNLYPSSLLLHIMFQGSMP